VRTEHRFLGVGTQTFQCLALREVRVVTLGEEARLVASDNTFEKTGGNLARDERRLSEKDFRRIPGRLTLKKRASIAAPDCVLPANFPTSTSSSLVPVDHSPLI